MDSVTSCKVRRSVPYNVSMQNISTFLAHFLEAIHAANLLRVQFTCHLESSSDAPNIAKVEIAAEIKTEHRKWAEMKKTLSFDVCKISSPTGQCRCTIAEVGERLVNQREIILRASRLSVRSSIASRRLATSTSSVRTRTASSRTFTLKVLNSLGQLQLCETTTALCQSTR